MWVDEANVIRALVALRLSVAGAFFIVFQLRMLILEKGTPVLAICPTDYTYDEMLNNISEVKARGAYVIGVSERDNSLFDTLINIPEVNEIYYPLVSVVPLQLLAFHSAIERGKDPDKPRNLAKSVTVR